MDERDYLSLKASVYIPGLQSVISAAWWFLAAFGLVSVWNFLGMPKVPAWAVAVVAFSVIGVVSWRALVDDWRHLMYGPEYSETTNQEPVVIHEPVRIELHSNDNRRVQFLDLPAKVEQLAALGQGVIQGVSLCESSWVGPDGVFTSRRDWCMVRDELVKRGFVQWRSPNNNAAGLSVTRPGEALFRHFASMVEVPTLRDY